MAVDVRGETLEMARKFGADVTINAAREDVLGRVRHLTGHGADAVIEAAASQQTINLMIELVRKEGRIGNVGVRSGLS